jgi:hypothetical protein
MYPYIGSYTKIATIFGTSHTRVRRGVLNDYSPKDNVTEDYDCAGKDFKDEYPPLSKKREHVSGKASWIYISARRMCVLIMNLQRQISPELDEVSKKRAKKDQIITRVPQKIPVVRA